jgi:hypothetical protein
MAMNKDTLGIALAKVVTDHSSVAPSPEQTANIQEFWKEIANEIISHIQNNAVVPAGIKVETAGSASAQTGSTTSTGTIM